MTKLHELQARIHAYADFAECIVEKVEWLNHGASISLALDYIWLADGSVRPDKDPKLLIAITVDGVQSAHFDNRLPPVLLDDLSRINWGFAEISRIEAVRSENSEGDSREMIELRARRENGVWITIIGQSVSFSEHEGAPAQPRW
jgi:hypothetical protein